MTKITPKVVREYIDLSSGEFRRQFRKVKTSDVRAFLENRIDEGKVNASYVSDAHRKIIEEADVNTSVIELNKIESQLNAKGMTQSFIDIYLDALRKMQDTPKSTHLRPLQDALTSFKVAGKTLDFESLKEGGLNEDEVIFDGDVRNKDIIEHAAKKIYEDKEGQLHTNVGFFDEYMPSLKVLSNVVTQEVIEYDEKVSSMDDALGFTDPKISDRRNIIYQEWEKVYEDYETLRKAIRDVIDAWGKRGNLSNAQDNKDFNDKYAKLEMEAIEDFDKEINELADVYNELDKNMNYVVEFAPVDVSITNTHNEEDLEQNIIAIIGRYASKRIALQQKDSSTIITERGDEADDYEEASQVQGEGVMEFGGGPGESKKQVDYREMDVKPTTEDEAKLEAMREQFADISSFGIVDPLYALFIDENDNEFGTYTKKSHARIVDAFEDATEEMRVYAPDSIRYLNDLKEELENMKDEVSDITDDDVFYLPLGKPIIKYIERYGDDMKPASDHSLDYDKVNAIHLKLLNIISDLLEPPNEKTRFAYSWFTKDAEVKAKNQSGQKLNVGMSAHATPSEGKDRRKEWGELSDKMSALIEAVHQYYVAPSEMTYYPFADKMEFMEKRTLTALHLKGKDSPVQRIRRRNLSLAWAYIKRTHLANINDWLEILQQPFSDPHDLINASEDIYKTAIEVMGPSAENDKFFLSWKIQNMIDNNSEIMGDDSDFENEPISNLAMRYEKNRSKYKPTIWALIHDIHDNKPTLSNNYTLKSELKRFNEITETMIDDILLKELNLKLLTAHDEIRKMNNKHIYYSYCDVNNFDSVSDTIDIIKSTYKTDVSANDIIGIVNHLDSLEIISQKYGINPDAVYHIKALYR